MSVRLRRFNWACSCGRQLLRGGWHYISRDGALAGLAHHQRTECRGVSAGSGRPACTVVVERPAAGQLVPRTWAGTAAGPGWEPAVRL